MHAGASDANLIQPDDNLLFLRNRRAIVQYAPDATGATELRIYYDDKEISFDEPELFAFGETLAKQTRFVASAVTDWAPGLRWRRAQELLGQLVEAGILLRVSSLSSADFNSREGVRSSPLPPATCPVARDWEAFEEITGELTGRAVELGYLELIVPVFRVAHIAVDAELRQVGEANVFPRALRLEVPTEWRTCNLPGSRFQSERPMNVTAMRSMRAHWAQSMAAILHVREGFLHRFPEADGAWTIGHIERLATCVLAVPTYALVRPQDRLANGALHPALSNMFRVTDGVRMTMHQMLFVPIGEPALPPDTLMTVDEILDYAERNYSFHSEHGVCAGPRAMVRELLQVLVEGKGATDYSMVELDGPVRVALEDLEAALDYGLRGLRAHAAVFTLWPAMARAYERIAAISTGWTGALPDAATALRDRMRGHLAHIRERSYLGVEQWRLDRDQVYADMYAWCGQGLPDEVQAPALPGLLAPVRGPEFDALRTTLHGILCSRMGGAPAIGDDVLHDLAAGIVEYMAQEQAALRAGSAAQTKINVMLQRKAPQRPLSGADINVHSLLQGAETRRLPYLLDELADILDIAIICDVERLSISDRVGAA